MSNLPPFSLEAEEAILGICLVDPTAIARIDLPAEAFYSGTHQTIYQSMQSMAERQQTIDFLSLASALGEKKLEAVGGIPRLTELVELTFTTGNLDRLVVLVRNKWRRRKLIAACHETLTMAHDDTMEWDDLCPKAEEKLSDALSATTGSRGLVPLSDVLVEVYNQLDQGVNPSTATKLDTLDKYLSGGFRGGELIVVAGRPAMGKSFVATYLARSLCHRGAVALFSLEMDNLQIAKRMLATEAHIAQSTLTANAPPTHQFPSLVTALGTLSQLPIYLDDTPGTDLTIQSIRAQCHQLQRRHDRLGLIVVDYLQLIGDQGSSNRVGELGRYSSALKSMAKVFDCPVVALSQLSRGVESRNDKRPVMSDIRSSGAIEQDADVILMLYRDEYYNPDTTDPGTLEIIVAKNRHGQCGTAKAYFDPAIGTISNPFEYPNIPVDDD